MQSEIPGGNFSLELSHYLMINWLHRKQIEIGQISPLYQIPQIVVSTQPQVLWLKLRQEFWSGCFATFKSFNLYPRQIVTLPYICSIYSPFSSPIIPVMQRLVNSRKIITRARAIKLLYPQFVLVLNFKKNFLLSLSRIFFEIFSVLLNLS